jgi:hypothetical protein
MLSGCCGRLRQRGTISNRRLTSLFHRFSCFRNPLKASAARSPPPKLPDVSLDWPGLQCITVGPHTCTMRCGAPRNSGSCSSAALPHNVVLSKSWPRLAVSAFCAPTVATLSTQVPRRYMKLRGTLNLSNQASRIIPPYVAPAARIDTAY